MLKEMEAQECELAAVRPATDNLIQDNLMKAIEFKDFSMDTELIAARESVSVRLWAPLDWLFHGR